MKETHTPFSVFFHVQSGQVFDCYDKKVTMTFTTTLHWEHYSHTLEDLQHKIQFTQIKMSILRARNFEFQTKFTFAK